MTGRASQRGRDYFDFEEMPRFEATRRSEAHESYGRRGALGVVARIRKRNRSLIPSATQRVAAAAP